MDNSNRYFFVRAMGQTDPEFEVFLNRSVVAVGWCKVDFTSFHDLERLLNEVQRIYYSFENTAPQVVSRKLNEVRRFKTILEGYRIIVPHYSVVHLATATAEEIYDRDVAHSLDLANQRRVKYVKSSRGDLISIPRSKLSEGLQRKLRVRGTTISDLAEFSEELRPLFDGKIGGWEMQFENRTNKLLKESKVALLKNIREGHTNLQAGGRGLEELVRELLEGEGYQAEILSKRLFSGFGDADIVASRSDRFGENRLLVQVKHHRGESNKFGADQLEQARRSHPKYVDSKLVVVTTGEASEELKRSCENRGIALIVGKELVDWIFDSKKN